MSGASMILWSVSVRAISPNGVFQSRTRATIGLKTDGLRTLPSRASAVFVSASYLPTAVGKLRTAIERTNSLVALAVRPFIQQGDRWICNLGRRQITAGKCFSFFRALVHDANQPASRVFHAFEIPPVLSSALSHANTRAWSGKHDEQRNRASGA